MAPPARATGTNRTATWVSPNCAREPASPFDTTIARVVRLLYMGASALSGDARPSALFHTFLADGRAAFDGTYQLRTDQVDRIIANSQALSERVSLRKRWLVLVFTRALAGSTAQALDAKMQAWADSIVARLKERAAQTRAVAFEDVTTQDLSDFVDPNKRGEWVQLSPDEGFSTYISFGQIGLYFSGRVTLFPASGGAPDVLQLDLHPALLDDFDFHFLSEDPGTGWMDHALARLQCTGFAKPFRIEGRGTGFRLVVTGAVPR